MDEYVDGKLYDGLGHWCAFCQCFHSSMSCFHPGRTWEPNTIDVRHLVMLRERIEEEYEEHPTGCGGSFDEILCYEIHHGSDGEHEGGLTFKWLAAKWCISVTTLGELIWDHCRKL